MLNDILFGIFIFIGTFNLIHFGLYLVSANVYDVSNILRKNNAKKPMLGRPPLSARRPLVSVLIPAYNEAKVIERNLRSVWNSTYDKVEMIIINDGSFDNTKGIIRQFISEKGRISNSPHGKIVRTDNGLKRIWEREKDDKIRRIYLINQRNTGKANALNNALRSRHINGELIMTLDGDSVVAKSAIANAVSYFDSSDIVGVAANVRIIEEPTVLGMLQRFEHLISYRSKKFYSITNSELIVGGVASTYRYSTLKSVGHYEDDTVTEDIGLSMKIASKGNKKHRLVYGADIMAFTEGVFDFKTLLKQRYRWKLGNMQNVLKYRSILFSRDKKYTKSLTFYRMSMAFFGEVLLALEPIILLYVIYLSLQYLTIGLFLGAYMTITLYLLLTIWPDEHMKTKAKLKASLQTPILYFVFYIMNYVQLISLVKCFINYKQITGQRKTATTWISPLRRGLTVLPSAS